MKYTKEVLEEAVNGSVSILEVLRKLGIKQTGGSHGHISRKIKAYGIDTSHILGQGASKGKKLENANRPKLKWEDVLILHNKGRRQLHYLLKRALLDYGKSYECCGCGNKGEWNNKPLTLQVHHKNNNWLDDRPENLEFICPNCHSILRPGEGN